MTFAIGREAAAWLAQHTARERTAQALMEVA